MKIISIFVMYAVIFIVACFDYSWAQTTQKPSSNGTRKLQITENSNPQVSYGTAFDEITVESNLNIRGKNPSSRSQRTQLFPVKTANASDTKANENKPNNIKLANA